MKNLKLKRWSSLLIALALFAQVSVPATFADDGDVHTETDVNTEEVDAVNDEMDEEAEEEMEEEEVDSDNAVEILEEAIEEEENVDKEIDEIVEELAEDVENEDEAEDVIEDVEEDVEEAIEELEEELENTNDPAKRVEIEEKIRLKKAFLLRLRAKLISKHKNLAKAVKAVREGRKLYTVRWGVLDQRNTSRCPGLDRDAIKSALDSGETPECKDVVKAEYEGALSVNKGEMAVKKLVLFEKNDEMLNKTGDEVEWNSVIAGHWDGFVVEYMPSDESGEVEVTLSIGDVKETFTSSDIFGRKAIGNGHHVEIKHLAQALSGVKDKVQDKLVENKVEIQDKIEKVRDRLRRVQLLRTTAAGDVSDATGDLEDVLEDIEEYNFDDLSADEISEEVDSALDALSDGANKEEIQNRIKRLRQMFASIKGKAKERKFNDGLTPFRDTDDSEWYTKYVAPMKDKGIVSGYKDANGNELGEYRPGNNVTVAEILKIGLETSNSGDSKGNPNLRAALNHWAKAYVKRAEELGLDIVGDDTDLNRPATRAEVVRMMLEAAGVDPDVVTNTEFSDVSGSHKHAAFIALAAELGIVSGDDGASTFRPDEPINRAEVAKIANQILEVLLGGLE